MYTEAITRLLNSRKLTGKQLAKILNVSVSTACKLKREPEQLTFWQMRLIVRSTDISSDEFKAALTF